MLIYFKIIALVKPTLGYQLARKEMPGTEVVGWDSSDQLSFDAGKYHKQRFELAAEAALMATHARKKWEERITFSLLLSFYGSDFLKIAALLR